MPKPHERDDTFVKRKEVTEKESTTPRLERLLPTSVRFSAAYAPMPTTLPSHSSMFTGRLPRSLGVLKNGQVLATSAVTLTEILRDHGYHTAAIVSSFVLNRRFGTAQGFDSYDDDFPETPCKLVGKSWERFDLEGSFCRRGNLTTDAAVTWLEKMGYRIAIYPSESQRAAIYAMRMALGMLKKDGTTEAMDGALTTFKERDMIVGLDDWQSIERRYMAGDT